MAELSFSFIVMCVMCRVSMWVHFTASIDMSQRQYENPMIANTHTHPNEIVEFSEFQIRNNNENRSECLNIEWQSQY